MPPGPGGGSLARGRAALLAAAVGFGVFAPTLGYDFVWDDRASVLFNQQIRSLRHAPAWFSGHAFTGASGVLSDISVVEYYRPVWVLSLAVDHAFWGERAAGYHLTNLLLHALASGLVAWLVFELLGCAAAAALAGALFAVHPAHAEAVAWISARNELQLGVFLLVAFIAYVRFRRGGGAGAGALCLASFVLALLSKETAVLFPAFVLLYEWTRREGGRERKPAGSRPTGAGGRARNPAGGQPPGADVRAPSPAGRISMGPWAGYGWALLLLAVAAAFFAIRAGIVSPLPVRDPLLTRLASAPGLVVENLRLLFVPIGLKVLHTFEPVSSPFSAAAILPAALLLGILALLPRASRRDPNLGFGLGWILLALLPVSGLLALLQPTPLAERYLYLPSVGWALIVGSLIAGALSPAASGAGGPAGAAAGRAAARAAGSGAGRAAPATSRAVPRGRARVPKVIAILAILAFAAASIVHIQPWRNDLALATRMCRDAPRLALAHASLGLAWHRLEGWPEAARAFATAARLRPADPWSHYYLGVALRRTGRLEPAERALRNAIALQIRYAPAHLELGDVLERQDRLEEAERQCRAAIDLDSSLVEAHSALGRVLYRSRRHGEAESAYRRALGLRPDDARTRSNLGGLHMAQGRWEEAIAELERACALDPRLADAHFNLGSALFARRRLEEAERALRAGLALRPGAGQERFTLGQVLIAAGKDEDAAVELREALRAAPADSSLQRAATQALAGLSRRR